MGVNPFLPYSLGQTADASLTAAPEADVPLEFAFLTGAGDDGAPSFHALPIDLQEEPPSLSFGSAGSASPCELDITRTSAASSIALSNEDGTTARDAAGASLGANPLRPVQSGFDYDLFEGSSLGGVASSPLVSASPARADENLQSLRFGHDDATRGPAGYDAAGAGDFGTTLDETLPVEWKIIRIPPDGEGLQTTQSSSLIRLNNMRADPRFAGIDGGGYSVVVIDTGADLDHPAFGPDSDGNGIADRIVFQYDFSGANDSNATDTKGHGTNVAGIVGSQNPRHGTRR